MFPIGCKLDLFSSLIFLYDFLIESSIMKKKNTEKLLKTTWHR